MKQQIQIIDSQTAKLNQNQFERNQGFLALYNLTTVRFDNAEHRLQTLDNFKNNTRIIEARLKNVEAYKMVSLNNTNRLNTKTETLQTQISNNNQKGMDISC